MMLPAGDAQAQLLVRKGGSGSAAVSGGRVRRVRCRAAAVAVEVREKVLDLVKTVEVRGEPPVGAEFLPLAASVVPRGARMKMSQGIARGLKEGLGRGSRLVLLHRSEERQLVSLPLLRQGCRHSTWSA